MDTQWAAPILRTAFPGKPILAHFTLRAEEERDTAAAAQLLATLAGAGYTDEEKDDAKVQLLANRTHGLKYLRLLIFCYICSIFT